MENMRNWFKPGISESEKDTIAEMLKNKDSFNDDNFEDEFKKHYLVKELIQALDDKNFDKAQELSTQVHAYLESEVEKILQKKQLLEEQIADNKDKAEKQVITVKEGDINITKILSDIAALDRRILYIRDLMDDLIRKSDELN